jgi:putative transposase
VRIQDILKSIKQSVARKAVARLRVEQPEWLDRLRVRWPSGRLEYRFWQQGGGYDRNLVQSETVWKVIDYIHNNPVRRGLATTQTDWPWSSARSYAGTQDWMLQMDLPMSRTWSHGQADACPCHPE